MLIADSLKAWRKANGLTREQAAVKIGVSMRTVVRWEANKPVSELALRLVRDLGIVPSADTAGQVVMTNDNNNG